MTHASHPHLAYIDRSTLIPPVRQVLGADDAEILNWEVEVLPGGMGDLNTGAVAILRFRGHAHVRGEGAPWSLVLKSIRATDDDENADYLMREWFAYRSGFLQQFQGPIVAPRCFGAGRAPDNRLWIWMESVDDAFEQPWPVARHVQTARSFGQWNGAYTTVSPLPHYDWFCQNTSREWAQQAAGEIEFLRRSLALPQIQRLFPDRHAQRLLSLWDEREMFHTALEHLPQTICHNDVFGRNLFGRCTGEGHEQIVAIDWANLGRAAIGEEAAAMVFGNLFFNEVELSRAAEFSTQIFEAYLGGLRDVSWHGDARIVRLAFCAAAAMKYTPPFGLYGLCYPEGPTWLEQTFNRGQAEAFAGYIAMRAVLLDLADEARGLMDELGMR